MFHPLDEFVVRQDVESSDVGGYCWESFHGATIAWPCDRAGHWTAGTVNNNSKTLTGMAAQESRLFRNK